jgi:hypothetical protein
LYGGARREWMELSGFNDDGEKKQQVHKTRQPFDGRREEESHTYIDMGVVVPRKGLVVQKQSDK